MTDVGTDVEELRPLCGKENGVATWDSSLENLTEFGCALENVKKYHVI